MAQVYQIQAGDTYASIAAKLNVPLDTLLKYNPTQVHNGQVVPTSGSMVLSNGTVYYPDTQAAPAQSPLEAQLAGVQGTAKDAYAALKTLFDSYGLSSLSPTILQYLQNGYGADTVSILLQQTDAYKQRFAGNDARIANGLAVLTPAEYLSTEAAYRQVIQAAGLDSSLYDKSTTDEWIGRDISPQEIQTRATLAVQATSQASPWVQDALKQLGISQGDAAGYFLNDDNALPGLQMKLAQGQIMGAGMSNGLTVDQKQAMTFAQQGVTQQQALAGYQKIAQVLPAADMLSTIYSHQQRYDQGAAENEFLGNQGQYENMRLALGRQETAAFSGQGGIGDKTLKPQGQPEF